MPHLSIQSLVLLLVVGGFAGWIAGLIIQRRGFGVIGNIILGVIGAAIGGTLRGMLGFSANNLVAELISAIVGAVLLLVVIHAIFKKK